jgi:hypothetical protein
MKANSWLNPNAFLLASLVLTVFFVPVLAEQASCPAL